MYLINKVKAVNRVYKQLDVHTAGFRKRSTISCIAGCGRCCSKPDIEATVLEFLPAAYQLVREGKSDAILEKIENGSDPICVFYNPFSSEGSCSNYDNRGLVCRLFGFSSRTDKHGQKSLVACTIIKQSIVDENKLIDLNKAPEMSAYYMKLFGIDPKLSVQYLSINKAVYKALEIVLFYFQFRKKRA